MKYLSTAKKYSSRLAVVAGTAATSAAVHAGDYSSQIATASSEANGNQTAVITAVVGLAVIGFGVSMFLRWLNK
ncbi:hypothetical protein PTW35_09040 [Photobacterium sp. DA100]|uniref:hypothetical protein n=1 Tax=Photobacterium sp. DA100 TaxID=3027472 RepID=UPI0024790C24|nr:hypothetical protein [Photobacterium sp. DA100]WEM43902.1 hypothetical protein PTW35_09040 [Photobacterium sp. DA100]